jgi:hypothetical protein
MTGARGVAWPSVEEAVGQDPSSMEDQAWLMEYDLDRAIEAHQSGRLDAADLALDCVRRAQQVTTGIDEFHISWLHAAEIVRAQADPESIATILSYLEPEKAPRPRAIRAQRARLQAVAGAGGSLAPAQVEQLFREALATANEWGSALYVAHISADLGVWLLGQDRADDGAELVAAARDFYERVGAQHLLEELADRVAQAS